ncbi:hypothetical protein [Kitasatospora sp. GAS204B]|uniref:hypothetical protein n=1 Tax=unclassified Kitasatospora TaxID=2633591 RepID=UPI0024734971|nr:hypothetical protein [Kitasatospora sp. GAS204B]MDH6116829.1 hypothetical protein [Kitasatospora sp. GAS204B]
MAVAEELRAAVDDGVVRAEGDRVPRSSVTLVFRVTGWPVFRVVESQFASVPMDWRTESPGGAGV